MGFCIAFFASLALQKSEPPMASSWSDLCTAAESQSLQSQLNNLYAIGGLTVRCTPCSPGTSQRNVVHAPLTLSTSDCILFRERGRSRHSFRSLEKTELRGKIAWMATVWMVHGALLLWQLRRGVRIRRQDGQFVAHLHFEQHRTLRKLDSCRIAGKERSAA